MPFELRDHTADVAVAATGATMGAVFGAVADGMAAAMCDDIPPEGGERFDLAVTAEGAEPLLFDYLDELIYRRDVDGVLPVDNEAAVEQAGSTEESEDGTGSGDEEWRVTASARGVLLSSVSARDLKAVTYSEMELVETDDGWRAYVVFDV
jgi:SHS2 domain-containing protein